MLVKNTNMGEVQQRLGRKYYELANHLGNVLAVVTDNINMGPTEGVDATAASITDYYPLAWRWRAARSAMRSIGTGSMARRRME